MGKISGIFTPMLEQVFVPLELDRSALLPGWREPQAYTPEQAETWARIDIWQLLARAKRDPIYSQIAIFAWGGYGKTTLLRHIAYRWVKTNSLMACLASFRCCCCSANTGAYLLRTISTPYPICQL
jgi:hypothetical protein